MRRSRFSEDQIISVLKEHEAGMKTQEVCRKHGIRDAAPYKWKAKYGGMTASETAQRDEDIVQRQAGLHGDDSSFLNGRQGGTAPLLRAHRRVLDRRPGSPLPYRLFVDLETPREFRG